MAENTKPATKILKARRMTRAWGDQPPTLEVALRYAGLTELGLRAAVDSVERELILLALLATRGNITHAARQLHITRPTLYSLIKKHKVPATTLQVIHH